MFPSEVPDSMRERVSVCLNQSASFLFLLIFSPFACCCSTHSVPLLDAYGLGFRLSLSIPHRMWSSTKTGTGNHNCTEMMGIVGWLVEETMYLKIVAHPAAAPPTMSE